MTGDLLPTVIGLALVAAAAAFALLPFARGVPLEPAAAEVLEPATDDRFAIYRQVLELEFDYEMGKLSAADYAAQSTALLGQASAALRAERGSLVEIDDEIEREIVAARSAFAAARGRRPGRKTAGAR